MSEDMEVTNGEHAEEVVTGTDDLQVREPVLPSLEPGAEAGTEAASPITGEAESQPVDAGDGAVIPEPTALGLGGPESPNVGNEQPEGTGEDVPVDTVTEPAYDYTTVYANDGMYVICETQTTVHWFEQKVVGIKVREDGTEEIVDLGNKAERYEEAVPATAHDLLSRGCTVPVAEDQPVEVLPTQTETNASVQAPQELAVTGLTDVTVPVTLGAIALVVIGAWLIANAQAKRIGRKNK